MKAILILFPILQFIFYLPVLVLMTLFLILNPKKVIFFLNFIYIEVSYFVESSPFSLCPTQDQEKITDTRSLTFRKILKTMLNLFLNVAPHFVLKLDEGSFADTLLFKRQVEYCLDIVVTI